MGSSFEKRRDEQFRSTISYGYMQKTCKIKTLFYIFKYQVVSSTVKKTKINCEINATIIITFITHWAI